MPKIQPINHGPLVDQFYADLLRGNIAGIRPAPALMADVFRLYLAWARRNEVPAIGSSSFLARALIHRHQVLLARKRHAHGMYVYGPHSVLFLGGTQHFPPGREAEMLGEQVRHFAFLVDRYEREADPQMSLQLQDLAQGAST